MSQTRITTAQGKLHVNGSLNGWYDKNLVNSSILKRFGELYCIDISSVLFSIKHIIQLKLKNKTLDHELPTFFYKSIIDHVQQNTFFFT